MSALLLMHKIKCYEDLFQFISAGEQTDRTIGMYPVDIYLCEIKGGK